VSGRIAARTSLNTLRQDQELRAVVPARAPSLANRAGGPAIALRWHASSTAFLSRTLKLARDASRNRPAPGP